MERPHFLATVASVLGLASASAASAQDVPGGADLVERNRNFDAAAFAVAVGRPNDIRQLWQNAAFRPGVLSNIKNALNGLIVGFGYAPDRVKLVTVNHGPSVVYTYSDYVWQKYAIGDFFDLKDAAGARIASNVFFPAKNSDPSTDPELPTGAWQDVGIAALQARGVVFLTCHTAVEEQARGLIKAGHATGTPADVSADILTHLIPGAIVVPSGVATVAVLQQKYGYSYATIQ